MGHLHQDPITDLLLQVATAPQVRFRLHLQVRDGKIEFHEWSTFLQLALEKSNNSILLLRPISFKVKHLWRVNAVSFYFWHIEDQMGRNIRNTWLIHSFSDSFIQKKSS